VNRAFAAAPAQVAAWLRDALAQAGLPVLAARETLSARPTSTVERLFLADGTTVIAKYASGLEAAEAAVLRRVHSCGVPVPRIIAESYTPLLVMLLEDFGPLSRPATDLDAATAAGALHLRTALDPQRHPSTIPALIPQARGHLLRLRAAGRYLDTPDLDDSLTALASAAPMRLGGHQLPPYGLVHGELHPTSLHIAGDTWHLLDFGKAFTGPQILDLATWQGTREAPDIDRLACQLDQYVAAGGRREVLSARSGIPATMWALGWHRVWAAHWYLKTDAHGRGDGRTDDDHLTVLRRQLATACDLLC
jgi:hypothetical protein